MPYEYKWQFAVRPVQVPIYTRTHSYMTTQYRYANGCDFVFTPTRSRSLTYEESKILSEALVKLCWGIYWCYTKIIDKSREILGLTSYIENTQPTDVPLPSIKN
jgi:hypothetical protein